MSASKIILGVDPGTTIMGFGLIQVNGSHMKFLQMNELRLQKVSDPYLKLRMIYERTIELIDTYHPDEMALEAPFFGKNVQSMLKLGRAQGVAMAAGLANLDLICQPGFYDTLSARTESLVQGVKQASADAGVPMAFSQVGGMFGMFFTDQPCVQTFEQVMRCEVDAFKRFFHGMLQSGVYLAPSAFEAGFISQAHTDEDIHETINAAQSVLKRL